MIKPINVWAATSVWKDGERFIHEGTVAASAGGARMKTARMLKSNGETDTQAWHRARRKGWRVIRVQITPSGRAALAAKEPQR